MLPTQFEERLRQIMAAKIKEIALSVQADFSRVSSEEGSERSSFSDQHTWVKSTQACLDNRKANRCCGGCDKTASSSHADPA